MRFVSKTITFVGILLWLKKLKENSNKETDKHITHKEQNMNKLLLGSNANHSYKKGENPYCTNLMC